jgi:YrbI family 3-deoxy-D-manno-octulosonate 8-phosphate phosphatase
LTSGGPGSVRFVFFDFDGVFTDNGVYVDQDGNESVRCSRLDGVGLSRMRGAGVDAMVITKEVNPVVARRCAKLKVPCVQVSGDKLPVLKAAMAERGVSPQEACFVGNDLPDAECLRHVGFPVIVSDSVEELHAMGIAKYVTKAKGGHGAVREVCDLIYNSQKNGR